MEKSLDSIKNKMKQIHNEVVKISESQKLLLKVLKSNIEKKSDLISIANMLSNINKKELIINVVLLEIQKQMARFYISKMIRNIDEKFIMVKLSDMENYAKSSVLRTGEIAKKVNKLL